MYGTPIRYSMPVYPGALSHLHWHRGTGGTTLVGAGLAPALRAILLTPSDTATWECLTIRVARKLSSWEVIEALADLFLSRGLPTYIRSDNGPESTATPVARLPTSCTRCARLAASDQLGGQTTGDSLTFKLVQTMEADQ